MFLQQLFEAIDKQHAAFCFGRMNPPTIGHGQLIDTVANAAAGGDYFVFVSQTQDSKKNPLDYQTKIKFVKAMFPTHAGHVVDDTQLKTIIQIAQWLYNKGYRAVTFVAGGDRIAGFTELLNKYNGQGQEGDAGYYKFDTINVASSGDRDPDAEGVAGVSASAARSAAAAGDLSAFTQATGAGKLAEPLYTAVRRGMLIDESLDLVGAGLGAIAGSNFGATGALIGGAIGLLTGFIADEISKINKLDNFLDTNVNQLSIQQSSITIQNIINNSYHGYTDAIDVIYSLPESQYKEKTLIFVKSNWDQLQQEYKKIRETKATTPVEWASRANQYANISVKFHEQMVSVAEANLKYIKKTRNPVAEGASGYIPKNKREAKDPRYSSALTVDIRPGAINKNLKALRL